MLIALGSLGYGSQLAIGICILSGLSYELVLGVEVLESSFFAAHFILQNFYFGFQFDVFVFMHVGLLLHSDGFFVELLILFLNVEVRFALGICRGILADKPVVAVGSSTFRGDLVHRVRTRANR